MIYDLTEEGGNRWICLAVVGIAWWDAFQNEITNQPLILVSCWFSHTRGLFVKHTFQKVNVIASNKHLLIYNVGVLVIYGGKLMSGFLMQTDTKGVRYLMSLLIPRKVFLPYYKIVCFCTISGIILLNPWTFELNISYHWADGSMHVTFAEFQASRGKIRIKNCRNLWRASMAMFCWWDNANGGCVVWE